MTTDIIVGFPGESDEDFQATMDLLEGVRYHGSFSFIYSSRPPAKSCEFEDTISQDVKKERLAIYQARQKEITMERNREYVGQTMEIMVEGESRNAEGQWSGRTSTHHIVNFTCGQPLVPGTMLMVRIDEACYNSLRGTLTKAEGLQD